MIRVATVGLLVAALAAASLQAEQPPPAKGRTILLVDDHDVETPFRAGRRCR